MLFCLCIFTMGIACATDYILYVRPGGAFGKELKTYWNGVKNDSAISHKAIRNYPPHCSLTGFFPKTLSKAEYIQAAEDAIEETQLPRTITINGLIQGNVSQMLDYIKLSSSYLLAVTQAFMQNASLTANFLKNPQKFPYHITLRKHVFLKKAKNKLQKIQKLENKINLKAVATWSLYLYERDSAGNLSVVKEFPL